MRCVNLKYLSRRPTGDVNIFISIFLSLEFWSTIYCGHVSHVWLFLHVFVFFWRVVAVVFPLRGGCRLHPLQLRPAEQADLAEPQHESPDW